MTVSAARQGKEGGTLNLELEFRSGNSGTQFAQMTSFSLQQQNVGLNRYHIIYTKSYITNSSREQIDDDICAHYPNQGIVKFT